MKVICPVCGEEKDSRGLIFHIRNNHMKEYKEIGWRKLKAQARKVPKIPTKSPVKGSESGVGEAPKKPQEFEAWTEETQKKLGFFPSPASLAIINRFTTSTDPSEFINQAIINEGKRRGITAALIKTESGESLELMGTEDSDKEFNRLLKLITAQNQVNQSYNPNSPMVMLMQMMKEKVNNGMSMSQFWKELTQMIMTIKLMEGM
ncbi:MAG: hypothetical protein ACTSUF_03490 [Candidatus Heimdallarchaeaceae archaeon]